MLASFIIPTHSNRLDNLTQTLRNLQQRDQQVVENSELVIVSEDYIPPEQVGFKSVQIISLNCDLHNKSLQVNEGVRASKADNLVILDSDRVLPPNYFGTYLAELHDEIITTKYLFRMKHPVEDAQIGDPQLRVADHRTLTNQMFMKNAFSGNALLKKETFYKFGGFDEEYIGCGSQDSDATEAATRSDIPIRFIEAEEYHLYHPPAVLMGGEVFGMTAVWLYGCINAIRFVRKWGVPAPPFLYQMISQVMQQQAYVGMPLFDRFKASVALLRV
jgi:glycosyltransferase involved in cell wall biosynthesis